MKSKLASAFLLILMLASVRPANAGDVKTVVINVKGVNIHYYVQGTGDPVVLIHGLLSSAWINWSLGGVDKELAKNHQVISLDLPGHGFSDKPEGDEAYGQQMVEDVVAVMDDLKVSKANIVGYSMGGMIAGRMMATHPDRINSCILGGMGWLQDGSGLQKFFEGAKGKRGTETDRKGLLYVPAACIAGFSKLAITEDQLKAIKLPVEVLVGDHDIVKQMYVDPLAKVRQDWPVILIKDAGHLDCIIKPQFKEEIVKWVDGHKVK